MKPGASHAIAVHAYISPFQLKPESHSHARRKYVNDLFYEGRYDSDAYASSRALDWEKDAEDHHYQWTKAREEYAEGEDEALARMLRYVSAENPPEKSPAEIRKLARRPIFRRGGRAG